MFSAFFFYCSAAHRDLHSFPTRRSSDLCSLESDKAPRSAGNASLAVGPNARDALPDRKSTRLNSSHLGISYAVFCLKKKTHEKTSDDALHDLQRRRGQHVFVHSRGGALL